MTKHWRVALLASGLTLACSPRQVPEVQTARDDLVASSTSHKAKAKAKQRKKSAGRQGVKQVAPRRAGDYFVHQFSGSFRQGPLTLIERVTSETDDTLTVDYTLEDGATERTLRVTLDKESEQPLGVVEITDDGEIDAPIAAYEAMLEKTVFSPDINEELIDETKRTCLVGPKELDCEVKQYRVYVGEQEANLTVTQSKELPGRDLGGEITGVDGSVIYRAELVEAGHTPPVDKSVAAK